MTVLTGGNLGHSHFPSVNVLSTCWGCFAAHPLASQLTQVQRRPQEMCEFWECACRGAEPREGLQSGPNTKNMSVS